MSPSTVKGFKCSVDKPFKALTNKKSRILPIVTYNGIAGDIRAGYFNSINLKFNRPLRYYNNLPEVIRSPAP